MNWLGANVMLLFGLIFDNLNVCHHHNWTCPFYNAEQKQLSVQELASGTDQVLE